LKNIIFFCFIERTLAYYSTSVVAVNWEVVGLDPELFEFGKKSLFKNLLKQSFD
jgi:hypothetical protein